MMAIKPMPFLSAEFIFFFALVIGSYTFIPLRWRWIHLLVSSLIFYGLISLPYLFLVIVLTLIDYAVARCMGMERFKDRKKILLTTGLAINLLVLVFFKYSEFFLEFIPGMFGQSAADHSSPASKLLIPLGISYYIFKKLSYLIDVYRENISPEACYFRLLLYVLFFPEVTAGPIDRAGALIPQFAGNRNFDRQRILRGFQLILWGLFKKLVIADRLAGLVNPIFNRPDHFSGTYLALATLAFSIQIYCDFSGYTDMALGIGHTLGYSLTENFDRPYFSRSVVEFWKRWHISLSTWLQDYLFLPLAYLASRKLKRETFLGIKSDLVAYIFGAILTMSLCGVWHGAHSTFLFWGFLHGIFLTLSFAFRKFRKRIRKTLKLKQHPVLHHVIQVILTFSLVSFAWIFFRANSLPEGFRIAGRILLGTGKTSGGLVSFSSIGFSRPDMVIAGLGTLLLLLTERFQPMMKFGKMLRSRPWWIRWIILYGLIFIILFFGVFNVDVFIYEGF